MNAQENVSAADVVATMVAARWGWKDSEQPLVQKTWGLLHRLGRAGARLRAEAEALRTSGKYSDRGLADAMAEALARDYAPAYRAADYEGRRAIVAEIERLRASGIKALDPTDAASAVLRSDLRRMFFGLGEHQRAAMLADPAPLLATALLELPGAFHGLEDHEAEALGLAAFGKLNPALAAAIEELQAVHAFTIAAVQAGRDEAMRHTGLPLIDFNEAVWGGTPADAA